ncbi:hypothetical protein COL32_10425 [Bacillus pseudomycoides]|uniref:hypothetical protein n=1 Tax=Bacillus pseudomycoides TaxID=64104 RepID=UPI000BF327BF|nr:hypothetical protein [Bacillus pseudomycoides]PFW90688.1 hypothetical protein COL29_20760 [Bacillus pseudomycoides]PFX45407.1 hypothetical protein COL32_10425 [Bacillus pseudomycoides]
MGRGIVLIIQKEEDTQEHVVYHYLHSRDIGTDNKWRFKIAKENISPDDAFELLDPLPEPERMNLMAAMGKVYRHIQANGGMEKIREVEFPEKLTFAV